ncbi:NUDIX hydrolase [Actinoallomurus soli]|uniref:NUDIX hydrolase n=1 Tax=Actinoallomurus soli TaxID=2952535 RepID=UPI0020925171|nr:NUDIX domain-containing protein [Actinoallomurus soli]MCO5971769.1 NUDIX domain-containing protein [Actinoallomurus soli]
MRVRCVGAIVHDAEGRLLLIRRGHPPDEGRWSIPGGRVEAGESDADAIIREVAEETGLRVVPGPLVGSVDRAGPGGAVYDIRDYRASVDGGVLRAGDDAGDVRWVNAGELAALPTTTGLIEALTSWGVLPTTG